MTELILRNVDARRPGRIMAAGDDPDGTGAGKLESLAPPRRSNQSAAIGGGSPQRRRGIEVEGLVQGRLPQLEDGGSIAAARDMKVVWVRARWETGSYRCQSDSVVLDVLPSLWR
jgi:hypothetical protein